MTPSRAAVAVVVSLFMVVLSFHYERYAAAGVFVVFFLVGALTLAAAQYDRRRY